MARERLVTRTITEGTVKIMAVDGRQVIDLEYSIGSVNGLNDAQVEAIAKEKCPEGKLFVKLESVTYSDVLYGMPESEFMKLAKVMPPRNTKVTDDTNE